MSLIKKIVLISLILTVFICFDGNFVLAQQGMETQYPTIGEYHPETVDGEGLPEYLRYVIRFFIIGATIVAFGALVYGGFLWMTSAGEPLKLQKSKERITASLIGLTIVFASYLFLNSIDPQLVELQEIKVEKVDDVGSPGVYLSLTGEFYEGDEEMISENVRKITSSERGLGSLDGNIQALRIVNPTQERGGEEEMVYRYVVVVHEETNFQGACRYYLNNQISPRNIDISDIGEEVSSITVIRAEKYGDDPYGGVEVYDKPEFQQGSNSQRLNVSATETFGSLDIETWSIDIEGNYAVILASGDDWSSMDEGCTAFTSSSSIPSLVGHRMNKCSPYFYSAFFAAYRSCSTDYALFPLYTR